MWNARVKDKEGWMQKNWCFWTVVLLETLESPLDCREIKPIYHKGNQSWIFIGRTDAKAKAPIFWPPDVKSQLTGKDPDAGKDWGRRRSGYQRMICLDDITNSIHRSLSRLWEIVKDREAWHAMGHGVVKGQRRLIDWTATITFLKLQTSAMYNERCMIE